MVGRQRVQTNAVRGLLVALIAIWVAGPAAASPETLRRSVGNILFAPLDLALAPVVAFKSINTNLSDIDDSPGVKLVWLVPGAIWSTGVQLGAAVVREFIGLFEFVPGLGLFFLEADMDVMFDPAEKADALVDIDTAPLAIKFGINYID